MIKFGQKRNALKLNLKMELKLERKVDMGQQDTLYEKFNSGFQNQLEFINF